MNLDQYPVAGVYDELIGNDRSRIWTTLGADIRRER
jgi:hypothetical protein